MLTYFPKFAQYFEFFKFLQLDIDRLSMLDLVCKVFKVVIDFQVRIGGADASKW